MDLRAILMGLGFALMWSSAFTSARIIVQAAPPLTVSAARFLIAGTIAVCLAKAMGQSWRLTTRQWRATAIFGICQNALYLGLFFMAMRTVEASVAAVVAASMPLWVALLGWLFQGARIGRLGIAGLAAGFAGVAVIMASRLSGGVDPVGLALCWVGVLALSVATLMVRGASSGGNLLMVVGLQMLIGGVILAVIGGLTEPFEVDWSGAVLAAFAYSVLVPGLIATLTWFSLVNRIGAVRAATFHFLNPVFGVVIAAVILSERLEWVDFLGVAIVTAGILAVQISRRADATVTQGNTPLR